MNTIKNHVRLMGNLGMVPEIKSFDNGRKLARFSLATNSYYKKEGGEGVKDTQWHSIVCWGRTAEYVEKYLTKGSEVILEGKLNNRSYTDTMGVKRYVTEIETSELMAINKGKSSN